MKISTYVSNGWKIQVHADRAPNGGKNLAHGNNTLIVNVPATLSLASGTVYNACRCGACVYFDGCDKTKGVRKDTDHCQLRPNRFQSARAI